MPFMGRDWRSPGEAWVKTESLGWQRMKIIESQLYLTACHQNHSACSWPPREQFGQHMANNCNKAQDIDCDKPLAAGTSNSRSARSLSNSSASSGSDSSGQSSASSSPTGTPERNSSSRHIHPITISSPYGRYSTSPCCTRRMQPSNQNNNNGAKCCVDLADPQMSRSLSRETIVESNCSTSNECPHRSISHNGSVPDFSRYTRDATPERASEQATQYPIDINGSCETKATQCDVNSPRINAPILMKNGVQIESDDPVDPGTESNDINNAGYHGDRSTASSPTAMPPFIQESDQSCHSACGCCCCSSHSTSSNPHHHIIMEPQPKTAPHCRISVRTREVAMHNTISEAFYRLDFYNAIHDIRRFNYICKLLHLLITQNLTSLSGCATRVLFTMLEQVAWEVSANKRNIHVIRNLLEELRLTIRKYYCWGRPIGSSLLWQQHFETIERISQIVNGIELSPPKDGSYRVTFSNLPVEMIREILYRLNDYRDLVSSAQASPLMQAMIDDQCIWRRLCRYHFTDQQLKLAFENNDLAGARKRTLRGVKYARTTTADGRSSYRKPVTHKQSSSTSATTTTRRQLEETADRRNPNASRGSNTTQAKSSQVTDAVKLFDRSNKLTGANGVGQSASGSSGLHPQPSTSGKENQPQKKPAAGPCRADNADRSLNPNRRGPEIDWEHVFHQLRKRFDLKEEYADCLLLCRHCRCLFWKSFGHPCIRSEDLDQENSSRCQSNAKASVNCNHHSGFSNNNASSSSSRPSVASLSRNFDRQVPYGGANGENMEAARNLDQQRAALNANQIHDNGPRADWQRRPLDNLNAQLQERNANRLGRQQNRRLDGQDEGGAHPGAPRREELVPKHVTITPQAFLKFFSL